MKEIKAIIQPAKLEKIREALTSLDCFPGMTVSRVEGCSPSEGRADHVPGILEQLTDFSPKIRLEILAPDDRVESIVRLIHRLVHTGHAGDGIVWVTEADHFYRLRMPLE